MPKSNPRASAIQAALQGFSSVYFPVAIDQIRAQQEISIKQALEAEEQANRESLEKTKFGYDVALQERKYGLEGEQARAKLEPSSTPEELSVLYPDLTPEQHAALGRLRPDEQRQGAKNIQEHSRKQKRDKAQSELDKWKIESAQSLVDARRETDISRKDALIQKAQANLDKAKENVGIFTELIADSPLPFFADKQKSYLDSVKLYEGELAKLIAERDSISGVSRQGGTTGKAGGAGGTSLSDAIAAEKARRAKK